MNILQAFLELLYPSCCPGCGTVTEPQNLWCRKCRHEIWNPRQISSERTPHLDGCYAVTDYVGGMRKSILRLKFSGHPSSRNVFHPLLCDFPWWDRLKDYQTVIPVPLYDQDKKKRGFNQVDFIFQEAFQKQGRTYLPHGLVKIHPSKTQSLLSKESRLKNIHGIFHVQRGLSLKGKKILLADDILTTGATLEEAARELKRAGASKVIGFVMASGA